MILLPFTITYLFQGQFEVTAHTLLDAHIAPCCGMVNSNTRLGRPKIIGKRYRVRPSNPITLRHAIGYT